MIYDFYILQYYGIKYILINIITIFNVSLKSYHYIYLNVYKILKYY